MKSNPKNHVANPKDLGTKKGLAPEQTKPETQNLQNTEIETNKLQGKGSELLPYMPNAPQLLFLKPKVTFLLFNRNPKTGINTVMGYIKYGDKPRVVFSTKVQGIFKDWNEKESRFTGKNYSYHNNILENIEFDLQCIYKELVSQKIEVSAEMIKRIYTTKGNDISVMELFTQLLEKQKALLQAKQIGKKSILKYKTTLNHFKSFLLHSKQENLLVKNVRSVFFNDIYEYMQLKGFKTSYLRKLFSVLKTTFEYAVNKEIIIRNPYISPRFPKRTEDQLIFLSEQELYVLENYKFGNDCLQKAADLFVFSCYTAFAYCDMESFKTELDTRIENNGTIWIYKRRQKTNETARLPLFPKAFYILEKYQNQLPILTNQKYNFYLKEIAMLLNINKKLTTHVARKTAAFIWLNTVLDYETVAAMLGHSNIAITQKTYAKVLTNRIQKKLQEVNLALFIGKNEYDKLLTA